MTEVAVETCFFRLKRFVVFLKIAQNLTMFLIFLLHKVNQIWLMSYARLFQKLSRCMSKND